MNAITTTCQIQQCASRIYYLLLLLFSLNGHLIVIIAAFYFCAVVVAAVIHWLAKIVVIATNIPYLQLQQHNH